MTVKLKYNHAQGINFPKKINLKSIRPDIQILCHPELHKTGCEQAE